MSKINQLLTGTGSIAVMSGIDVVASSNVSNVKDIVSLLLQLIVAVVTVVRLFRGEKKINFKKENYEN